MNENLRRALLRAQLTDEDVATRLEVDPKTVRRWLEGRLPHLRHRWALASMLDLDGTDLWPQLRPTLSRPPELRTIYTRQQDTPNKVWHDLLGSAEQEIEILEDAESFLMADPEVFTILDDRLSAGVVERICLYQSDWHTKSELLNHIRGTLSQYKPFKGHPGAQIRAYQATSSNTIYRADNDLLVAHHAFNIANERMPVLFLRRTGSNDIANTYIESFHTIWAKAQTLN